MRLVGLTSAATRFARQGSRGTQIQAALDHELFVSVSLGLPCRPAAGRRRRTLVGDLRALRANIVLFVRLRTLRSFVVTLLRCLGPLQPTPVVISQAYDCDEIWRYVRRRCRRY